MTKIVSACDFGDLKKVKPLSLEIVPMTLKEANAFVAEHHRHHGPVVGHKFSVGVSDGKKIVGVAIVGRPVSRHQDDGLTLEVIRLCTDGSHNACSMLYSACWRAAQATGYRRIITYILDTEPGTSLRAAGWRYEANTRAQSWDRPGRHRTTEAPTCPKQRWAQGARREEVCRETSQPVQEVEHRVAGHGG